MQRHLAIQQGMGVLLGSLAALVPAERLRQHVSRLQAMDDLCSDGLLASQAPRGWRSLSLAGSGEHRYSRPSCLPAAMSRTAWGMAGAGVLGLGGYLYATPYISIDQFREAIEARDLPAIERHVDFPKLRGSLKEQLTAKVSEEISGNDAGHPLLNLGMGALGMAIAEPMIEAAVDTYVSPAGLRALLAGSQPDANERPAASGQTSTPGRKPTGGATLSRGYKSPNLFVVTARDSGSGEAVRFNFERQGLVQWTLTSVSLP